MKSKTVFSGAVVLLSVLLLLSPSCKKQAFFAEGEASITITAGASSIDLNQNVLISIVGFNQDGSLLWDGTRVELTIENGTLEINTVELEDGRGSVMAMGDVEKGEMKITARSGTVVAEPNPLVVTVGESREVSQITANVSPSVLPYTGGRSQITARFFDANFDPIPDLNVVLETTAGTLSSGGAPLITDSSGKIIDYLQTTREATVTIYAGEKTKEVQVTLESEPDPNQQPLANFTYSPTEPISEETIYFNASESDDLDGYISNYSWDFGDGNTGRGKRLTHSYDIEGLQYKTYSVTLTVTDDQGAQNSLSKTVTVYSKN